MACKRTRCFVVVALAIFVGSTRAEARITGIPPNRAVALKHAARFAVVDSFTTRRTLEAGSLRELIQWTAPVARDAPNRYQSFAAYWSVSNQTQQRSGKALEAVLAWRANKILHKQNAIERFLVTAVEGHPTDIKDLVMVSPTRPPKAFQAKLNLNLRKANRFLNKYPGQVLVTNNEAVRRIDLQLRKREAKAIRRGIELADKWQRVRSALNNGTISRDWLGRRLPSLTHVNRAARRAGRKNWIAAIAELPASREAISATNHGTAKLLGKSFLILDVAGAGYAEFNDVSRYTRNEVGGDYLAAKSGIRVCQLYLTAYTTFSPEPMSKLAVGVVVVTLIVIDVATDQIYENLYRRRELATRRLLATIERAERYHAARAKLTWTLEAGL